MLPVVPLPLIMAGISGAVGLGKSIFGGIQAAKGAKRARKLWQDRPRYDIKPPEYFQDLLDLYRRQPATRAPGSEIRERETEADLAEAAKRLQEFDDTRSILGGVQSLYEKTLREKREIGRTDLEYAERERARLEAGRERTGMFGTQLETGLAREKYGEEMYLWQTEYQRRREQQKAGMENIFKGLTGVASTGMSWLTNKVLLEELEMLRTGGGGNVFTSMPGYTGS